MRGAFRKSIFAIPFGCLVAIATHFVRFGDEHVFGGAANEAVVATAVGGSIAIALGILHAYLTAGTTTMTGTLAASRARRLIPGATLLFAFAAFVYYGIESLEGNGIEVGLPTLMLVAGSILLAYALRRGAALIAHFVARIVRDWLTLLDRLERSIHHPRLQPQLLQAQIAQAAPRFGRAPPNGRQFP